MSQSVPISRSSIRQGRTLLNKQRALHVPIVPRKLDVFNTDYSRRFRTQRSPLLASYGIAISVDGLGAGRDIVFVEHAYDTCVRRPRLDRTYLPFTTASVAIRTWAAALRIKLTSARCHSVR